MVRATVKSAKRRREEAQAQTPIGQLEEAAIKAHENGVPWDQFWSEARPIVDEAEPFCFARWDKIRIKLHGLHLSGGKPIWAPGEPWWDDDDTPGEAGR